MLAKGDGFKFVRPSGHRGHLTASGVDPLVRWVYGRDRRSLCYVIRIEDITRICDPPMPEPQRDLSAPPRRGRRRRR